MIRAGGRGAAASSASEGLFHLPAETHGRIVRVACHVGPPDRLAGLHRSAQGIEFLRPLKSSTALEQAHALLRAQCASIERDRYLAPEIERATLLVRNGALSAVFRSLPAGDAASALPALWIPV